MKAVFSAQPRKLNFLSSARGLPPDSAVPSLSLALRPEMGFLPHFIMHLLVTSSLSSIPSRPFCLTEAGLRALLSRHSMCLSCVIRNASQQVSFSLFVKFAPLTQCQL